MVAASHTSVAEREGIRNRIAEIERQLDEHRYRPGPWELVLKDLRALHPDERAELKGEVSRISGKLHRRDGRATLSLTAGLAIEGALTVIATVLIIVAQQNHSNLLGIIAAAIWVMTFQPLLKIGVGYLLGVEYEYAYLYGAEPRFKMRYGDFIAAPRWARILLHLSGTVGSPLGAWLATICLPNDLTIAIDVCWVLFWIVVAVNVASFLLALGGVRRLGPFKASYSSGGAAALDLREGLEMK
ncbi:MAG TPA: hypothetical protein VN867_09530 [Candidatus Binataceae bacterium]|nr:hypothetical protein [Candidatus Binataceae bacterium]